MRGRDLTDEATKRASASHPLFPYGPHMSSFSEHEIYSDVSSSYWPPGWFYDRFSRATDEEIGTLPEDEAVKMYAGLHEALGHDGFGALSTYIRLQQEKHRAREAGARGDTTFESIYNPKQSPPAWLDHWRKWYRGQKWGVVVFRTALYDDEPRWNLFKDEVHRIVSLPFWFSTLFGPLPDDYVEAWDLFEVKWIEDPTLAGANAETLRVRFDQLKSNLPEGLVGWNKDLFLCASPDAVVSVLSLDTNDRPTTSSRGWRSNAPFLLGVAAYTDLDLEEGHNELEWFKPVFKVAIENVVSDFCPVMSDDQSALQRITRSVKGSDELGELRINDDRELDEIWFGMGPSPRALRRRMQMRGWDTGCRFCSSSA